MRYEMLLSGKLMNPFISKEEKHVALAEVAPSLFWERCVDQIAPQGLLPHLVECIDMANCADFVTSEIRRRARVQYIRNWKEFEAKKEIVVRLLDVAHESGITILVLKGWSLVDELYAGNAGCRPFNDIDIAVRMRDAPKMVELLRKLGGKVGTTSPLVGKQTIYIDGGSVELHSAITTNSPHESIGAKLWRDEAVWKRARTRQFSGRHALIYSPADTIVALAEHMIVLDDMERKPLRHAIELVRAIARYTDSCSGSEVRAVANSRGYPSALTGALLAARGMMGRVGRDEEPISCGICLRREVKARLLIGHSQNREETCRGKLRQALALSRWNALFTDTFRGRARLMRLWIFPSHAYVSDVLGKELTSFEYALYLLIHPVVIVLLLPALTLLWGRQIEVFLLSIYGRTGDA